MDALFNVVRPTKFSDMVGQETSTNAIKAGLEKGVLEHSLIFYGQTGGGKTTAARIVGSYLNCHDLENGEPCGKCHSCVSLREGNYPDYYELNAATNGGKDDIDSLIENVRTMPLEGSKKIFVIDEAHCLTTSAWKSLLKVLEETPAHCYFIMCTTNVAAIPPEIMNRCGKYEFKAIGIEDIYNYLVNLRNEYRHTNYSDDALKRIAIAANGSMRDAVNNYSHIRMPYADDETITEAEVMKYLSLVSNETISQFLLYCCLGGMKDAMGVLNDMESASIEAGTFYKAVMKMASDAISISCGAKAPLGCSEDYVALLKDACSSFPTSRLIEVAGRINEMYSNTQSRNYNALRLGVGNIVLSAKVFTPAGVSGSNADNSAYSDGLLRAEINELRKKVEELSTVDKKPESGSITMVGVVNNNPVEASAEDVTVVCVEQHASLSEDDEEKEEVNPLASLFAVSDDISFGTEEVESEEQLVEQTSTNVAQDSDDEYLNYLASMAADDIEDEDNDENPFVKEFESFESQSEMPVTPQKEVKEETKTQVDEQPKPTMPVKEEPKNTEPAMVGGIVFSDPSIAAEVMEAQKAGNRADKALTAAAAENKILQVCINECAEKSVGDDSVTIATPFQPVVDIVNAMTNYYNVKNVNVVGCDGLQFKK